MLRLIRGQKEGGSGREKSKQNSGPPEAAAGVRGPAGHETPEKIKRRDSLEKKGLRGGQPGPGPRMGGPKQHGLAQKAVKKRLRKRKVSRVRSINKVLLCLLLAILAYIFFEVVIAKSYLAKVEVPKIEEILLKSQAQPEGVFVEEPPKQEPLVKLKPLSYYTEQIGKRDLFKPLVVKGPPEKKQEPEATLEELAKDLVLKGIIAGPQPQAIIEEKKTQRTHFLNKGEKIGQIVIEDIEEGKVKLKFQDQEMNLAM